MHRGATDNPLQWVIPRKLIHAPDLWKWEELITEVHRKHRELREKPK